MRLFPVLYGLEWLFTEEYNLLVEIVLYDPDLIKDIRNKILYHLMDLIRYDMNMCHDFDDSILVVNKYNQIINDLFPNDEFIKTILYKCYT